MLSGRAPQKADPAMARNTRAVMLPCCLARCDRNLHHSNHPRVSPDHEVWSWCIPILKSVPLSGAVTPRTFPAIGKADMVRWVY